MTDKTDNANQTAEKKAWQTLELKVLDIPTGTKTGTGRIQPGEAVFLYRES